MNENLIISALAGIGLGRLIADIIILFVETIEKLRKRNKR